MVDISLNNLEIEKILINKVGVEVIFVGSMHPQTFSHLRILKAMELSVFDSQPPFATATIALVSGPIPNTNTSKLANPNKQIKTLQELQKLFHVTLKGHYMNVEILSVKVFEILEPPAIKKNIH